jgi:hypothetical protein
VKVTINSAGRVIEIDTNEDGMTAEKLTEIAENAWKRTAPTEAGGEQVGAGLGFTSQLGVRGRGYRHLGYGPLDAS